MTEPTMNAIPPRKTELAEDQRRGREVEDQAGDRDRVRRQPRLDQPVARVAAPLGGRPRLWARARDAADATWSDQTVASLGARRRPRPGRPGAGGASCGRGDRREAGDRGAGGRVEPVVVAGRDDHEEDQQRVRRPQRRARSRVRGRAPRPGTATISEKAMCMLGTAAYLLTSRLAVCESCATPVNAAIVSVKPSPGNSRGGAVGNSA